MMTNGIVKSIGVVCLLVLVFQQTSVPLSRIVSTTTTSTSSSVAVITTTDAAPATPTTLPTFHIVISSTTSSASAGDTDDNDISILNLRCIESIFYHHPKATLKIHVNQNVEEANENGGSPSSLASSKKLKPLIDMGYDIKFLHYNPKDVLQQVMEFDAANAGTSGAILNQTLAQEFLIKMKNNILQKDKYWYANEANLMRISILLLEGGIYLDTDVVLISPLLATNAYLDNTMGRHADGSKFHNAVMKFTQPNNPFLLHVLNNMFQYYNGTKWGNNGPKAFGRTSKEHPELICSQELSINQDHPPVASNDCLLHPLPNEAFAPVSYKHWESICFADDSPPYEEPNTKALLANSLVVHFNNKVTGKQIQQQQYKPGTLCDVILKEYCITCQE